MARKIKKRTVPTIALTDPIVGREMEPHKKWRFKTDELECKLKSIRCMHFIRPGRQCKNHTVFTLGYCHVHLKNILNLRVDRTLMTNRRRGRNRFEFLGLFACDKKAEDNKIIFRKGDEIVSYIGDVLTHDQHERKYPAAELSPYSIRIGGRKYIDGACKRGVAALANDCRRTNANCTINAEFGDSILYFPKLIATKTIRNGAEIFVSYGEEYWDAELSDAETLPKSYKKIKYKC